MAKNPFDAKALCLVGRRRKAKLYDTEVFTKADQFRGRSFDWIIWLRSPTAEEREAALTSLSLTLGHELMAIIKIKPNETV